MKMKLKLKLFFPSLLALAMAAPCVKAQHLPGGERRADRSALIQRAVRQQMRQQGQMQQAQMQQAQMQQPQGASRAASYTTPPDVPSMGDVKIPVLLVEFSDLSFSVASDPLNDFTRHCDGEQGSVARYYRDASENKFRPQFDVYGPRRLSHPHEYYGENNDWGYDGRLGQLCADATEVFNSEVDFSQYDNDADGLCDAVIILFAGPCDDGMGDAGHYVGACHFDMGASEMGHTVERDGVEINTFAVFNEQAVEGYDDTFTPLDRLEGIGCFVHEFGHCLGLPDLYQVATHPEDDYAYFVGMGYWDVMSMGTYGGPDWDGSVPVGFSAYEKEFLGWMDIATPNDGTTYTLPAHNRESSWGLADRAFRITHPSDPNEYFIVENRQLDPDGWDYYLSDNTGSYLSAGGLLVSHVIYDEQAWEWNEVNDYSLQRFTVVQVPQNHYRLFPGRGDKTELSATSTPKAAWSDGTEFASPLHDITRHDDGTVSFRFGDAAGIGETFEDPDAAAPLADRVSVNGTTLSAPEGATVCDLLGRRIPPSASGLYRSLPAGLYVVALPGQAVKVAIR